MQTVLIEKEKMRVRVPAKTWQDAVRQAGAVLEEAGSITHDYTEAMVHAVEELGPSEAVRREDLSLITLAEPVCFGSPNDPVSVILCVACTDRESHVRALQRVALALDEDDIFTRMAGAGTVDALFDILHHN